MATRRRGQRWQERIGIIDSHFPPHNLKCLEHLPTRSKRRNSLRLESLLIHHHHFLPRHPFELGVYLCSLRVRYHPATSLSTAGSKSSSSFFVLLLPLPPSVALPRSSPVGRPLGPPLGRGEAKVKPCTTARRGKAHGCVWASVLAVRALYSSTGEGPGLGLEGCLRDVVEREREKEKKKKTRYSFFFFL